MAHVNTILDKDPCFEVDTITRRIKNVSSTKTTVMQYDHNSERFSFTLPRFIEGHDMLECTKAEVHYINVDTPGVYEIEDLATDPTDENKITCSWLISQNATLKVGILNFLLRFSCIAEDGTIEYAWHTGIHQGIAVSTGMWNAEAIVEQNADVLEQWKAEIKKDVFPIIDTKTGAIVTIKDAANATLLDFTVNDDTPVESLKIVGKNVFHRDYATPVTNIGVTAEWNPDNQEFILNGTTTASGDIKLATNMQIDWVPNEEYLVSVRQVGGTAVLADGTNASTTYAWGIFQDNAAKYTRGSTSNKAFVEAYSFTATAFALDAERTYIFYFQCWRPGTVFDNYRVKVQIEKGTTMTDWEPYKGENIAIDDVKSYVLPKGYSKLTPVPSANISVEYVVDTKLYIDNKIAESALPNGDEVSY